MSRLHRLAAKLFFTRDRAWSAWDRLLGRGPRPERAVERALGAPRGEAEALLAELDAFGRRRFLMSMGPEKGAIIEDLVQPGHRVLELGCFIGYTAIRLASRGAEVTTLERDPRRAALARKLVEHAGVPVTVVEGAAEDLIPTLEGTFDLVLLDHDKERYLDALLLLEQRGLLAAEAIVVADNVGRLFSDNPGRPGIRRYLDHVRGHYDSRSVPARMEYSFVPDAVEISRRRSAARRSRGRRG